MQFIFYESVARFFLYLNNMQIGLSNKLIMLYDILHKSNILFFMWILNHFCMATKLQGWLHYSYYFLEIIA